MSRFDAFVICIDNKIGFDAISYAVQNISPKKFFKVMYLDLHGGENRR